LERPTQKFNAAIYRTTQISHGVLNVDRLPVPALLLRVSEPFDCLVSLVLAVERAEHLPSAKVAVERGVEPREWVG
tara:strand:+ start:1023 stop:1250 length:228 start_codon:yes stop_codon:yes gene_type:complete